MTFGCYECNEALEAARSALSAAQRLALVAGNALMNGDLSRAAEYLCARQIPNFFFHVTTAYDLLRHGGVEIGKSDYLGQLGFVDA